jgi:hypothetical protein
MEIPSMKRSPSGSLTIQFTSEILQGEIVQLTLQPSHSTAPLFLHLAQPLPAAFGFDPTPKRALTATTELAGRPVLYNKLGWTFKPVVGSCWQP